MADAGKTRAEIVARLESMRPAIHIVFALETLEYLARGGRIGKAQAFLGTTLNLKPLLGIVNGEVAPVGRTRGRRKALQDMIDHLAHQVSARGPNVQLAVTHALVPDEATEVARMLSQQFASPHALEVAQVKCQQMRGHGYLGIIYHPLAKPGAHISPPVLGEAFQP